MRKKAIYRRGGGVGIRAFTVQVRACVRILVVMVWPYSILGHITTATGAHPALLMSTHDYDFVPAQLICLPQRFDERSCCRYNERRPLPSKTTHGALKLPRLRAG